MQLFPAISNTQTTVLTPSQTTLPVSRQAEPEPFWGKDGFNFADIIDMVNPMQHMPVVAKYYREQTQDDASEGSRLVGGVLFGALMGGVTGILTSMANAAVRHETQYDVGEQLLMVAEETLDDFWADQDGEGISQQANNIQKNTFDAQDFSTQLEINPFFAQLFDEYSNDDWPSYQNSLAQEQPSQKQMISNQRMHDWGEV
jgi:hypothetical protein